MNHSTSTKPGQFLRKASGLVKELSATDTFIFNTIGYSLGLVLTVAPTFIGGLFPNANVLLVLTLGVVLTAFNGLVYGLFSAAMPRSGGDYVFIGRTLGPTIGFVANWGFSWSQFLGLGVYAAWCVRDALSPALATLGYATSSAALSNAGLVVSKPLPMFLVGTLLLGTVLLVSLAGMKLLKRFLNVLFLVAVAGTIVMIAVFLKASHEDFVAAFNAFMSRRAGVPDGYASVLRLAISHGLVAGQPTNLTSALMALPIGYWAFIGFTYSAYVGGEIKNPQRSQAIGILGSLALGYVFYMIAMAAYYRVVGRDFNNAVSLVQSMNDNPLPISGSMALFAGLLADNFWANLFMGISTFLWFYLLLFVMTAICVRNIFAWSFDQISPAALSQVTRRNGVPVVATLVVVALAELFMTIQVFFGVTFMNYIALFSVCFLIAGVAAIAFPYRRRELFLQAPSIVRRRIFGVPLIVVAGVGNTVLFLLVLFSALTNSGLSGAKGALPTVIVFAIYGGGVLAHVIAKRYRAKRGVDLDLLFDEIPPE